MTPGEKNLQALGLGVNPPPQVVGVVPALVSEKVHPKYIYIYDRTSSAIRVSTYKFKVAISQGESLHIVKTRSQRMN